MSRKILIVNGNPKERNFCKELANSYKEAAEGKFKLRYHQLANMAFESDLEGGYDTDTDLEEDLQEFQKAIVWADHVVIVTPVWWGSIPAKLKGLIDRTFLPGFAFKYHEGKLVPEKLLKNKTARIVMTMDTPPWYFRIFQGAPALKQLKITTLQFSGFKKVRNTMVGPVLGSSQKKRKQWINTMRMLGERGL